jgi:hypothetical protein
MHFLAENRGCGRVKVGSLSGESGRGFRGQSEVLSNLIFRSRPKAWGETTNLRMLLGL